MKKTKLEIAVLLQANGFEEPEALSIADSAWKSSLTCAGWLEQAASLESNSAKHCRESAIERDTRAESLRKVAELVRHG